jgi:tRNA threonylcarbamoyladenosine modification (KEOPS) complex Cgi121 subunit
VKNLGSRIFFEIHYNLLSGFLMMKMRKSNRIEESLKEIGIEEGFPCIVLVGLLEVRLGEGLFRLFRESLKRLEQNSRILEVLIEDLTLLERFFWNL